jgi:hypothetical protein
MAGLAKLVLFSEGRAGGSIKIMMLDGAQEVLLGEKLSHNIGDILDVGFESPAARSGVIYP